ncbi:uncharacterized protein V1516DRAFT_668993 [Lipomyces oligophaga]|uniref:uncharacterized protein n=1 Tax=Lipomyces oligophaga TaxID=45792 RepID=UPI0034CF117E
MDIRNQLVDMGFPTARIEAAMRNTDGSLEQAVGWLGEHPLDSAIAKTGPPPDTDEEISTEVLIGSDGEPIEPGEVSAEAGSLVCQDCSKRFRNAAAAEMHATRSGHTNFAESVEKIPELSPEQKAAKLEELRLRAAERKALAAKAEALESKNNEILRRKADKESAALIEKQKQIQAKKDAEARRREQREDVLAKQRIKDLIAADRKARQDKLEREKAARQGLPTSSTPAVAVASATTSGPREKKEYTESRLQIRIDGKPAVVQSFPVETTLFEVAHSVLSQSGIEPANAVFMTTFPTKRYSAEDMGMTLKEANLINVAVMLRQS